MEPNDLTRNVCFAFSFSYKKRELLLTKHSSLPVESYHHNTTSQEQDNEDHYTLCCILLSVSLTINTATAGTCCAGSQSELTDQLICSNF